MYPSLCQQKRLSFKKINLYYTRNGNNLFKSTRLFHCGINYAHLKNTYASVWSFVTWYPLGSFVVFKILFSQCKFRLYRQPTLPPKCFEGCFLIFLLSIPFRVAKTFSQNTANVFISGVVDFYFLPFKIYPCFGILISHFL